MSFQRKAIAAFLAILLSSSTSFPGYAARTGITIEEKTKNNPLSGDDESQTKDKPTIESKKGPVKKGPKKPQIEITNSPDSHDDYKSAKSESDDSGDDGVSSAKTSRSESPTLEEQSGDAPSVETTTPKKSPPPPPPGQPTVKGSGTPPPPPGGMMGGAKGKKYDKPHLNAEQHEQQSAELNSQQFNGIGASLKEAYEEALKAIKEMKENGKFAPTEQPVLIHEKTHASSYEEYLFLKKLWESLSKHKEKMQKSHAALGTQTHKAEAQSYKALSSSSKAKSSGHTVVVKVMSIDAKGEAEIASVAHSIDFYEEHAKPYELSLYEHAKPKEFEKEGTSEPLYFLVKSDNEGKPVEVLLALRDATIDENHGVISGGSLVRLNNFSEHEPSTAVEKEIAALAKKLRATAPQYPKSSHQINIKAPANFDWGSVAPNDNIAEDFSLKPSDVPWGLVFSAESDSDLMSYLDEHRKEDRKAKEEQTQSSKQEVKMPMTAVPASKGRDPVRHTAQKHGKIALHSEKAEDKKKIDRNRDAVGEMKEHFNNHGVAFGLNKPQSFVMVRITHALSGSSIVNIPASDFVLKFANAVGLKKLKAGDAFFSLKSGDEIMILGPAGEHQIKVALKEAAFVLGITKEGSVTKTAIYMIHSHLPKGRLKIAEIKTTDVDVKSLNLQSVISDEEELPHEVMTTALEAKPKPQEKPAPKAEAGPSGVHEEEVKSEDAKHEQKNDGIIRSYQDLHNSINHALITLADKIKQTPDKPIATNIRVIIANLVISLEKTIAASQHDEHGAKSPALDALKAQLSLLEGLYQKPNNQDRSKTHEEILKFLSDHHDSFAFKPSEASEAKAKLKMDRTILGSCKPTLDAAKALGDIMIKDSGTKTSVALYRLCLLLNNTGHKMQSAYHDAKTHNEKPAKGPYQPSKKKDKKSKGGKESAAAQ